MRIVMIVLFLIVASTLSGCFGSDDPNPGEADDGGGPQDDDDGGDPGDDGGDPGDGDPNDENQTNQVSLSLADLICDYTYPDNSTSGACDSDFTLVEAEAGGPPTVADEPPLMCIWQPEGNLIMDVSIHWDPVEDTYGLYYDGLQLEGPISGIFYTRSGEEADENIMAVWYDGPKSGYIPLPAPSSAMEDQQQFVVRFYTHSYESGTPGLQGGQIRAYWSLYNGQPYPLQAVEADGGEFYFHQVDTTDHATHPYDLGPFSMEGEDFDIEVQADHHLNIRTSFNHVPVYQCSI